MHDEYINKYNVLYCSFFVPPSYFSFFFGLFLVFLNISISALQVHWTNPLNSTLMSAPLVKARVFNSTMYTETRNQNHESLLNIFKRIIISLVCFFLFNYDCLFNITEMINLRHFFIHSLNYDELRVLIDF